MEVGQEERGRYCVIYYSSSSYWSLQVAGSLHNILQKQNPLTYSITQKVIY